ncbi:ras-related and estrogen-regulated growth inhibitor [Neocloeon triangulifer]|uniref:ras-related and estrogen-regulated growth inhibitor n=1 Tax=Neocloeon triangulifer TaxID=2078957 RepID=UPI00286F84DB|nr:ras-related and estrogen-regulated growth inhibitor [Neocloeon triangulifer]
MNIRRKKSGLTEVKVAVVGASGVGKTALTVRFLTKRYIGEYDHQNETRYKHETMVDSDTVVFEIVDTCPSRSSSLTANGGGHQLCSLETASWADGFVFVYAITDKSSLDSLRLARQQIKEARVTSRGTNWPAPCVLVAAKADLVHFRQVSMDEGEQLAHDWECTYLEVAAAEEVQSSTAVFQTLCREVLAARRRGKQSLLDRMFASAKSATSTKATTSNSPRFYARGKSDSALPP